MKISSNSFRIPITFTLFLFWRKMEICNVSNLSLSLYSWAILKLIVRMLDYSNVIISRWLLLVCKKIFYGRFQVCFTKFVMYALHMLWMKLCNSGGCILKLQCQTNRLIVKRHPNINFFKLRVENRIIVTIVTLALNFAIILNVFIIDHPINAIVWAYSTSKTLLQKVQ